ncbi:MAG: DinB family protein [Bacteroidota bacterium]
METPQQYIARILGNLEGKDAVKILKSTPKTIKKIITGVSKKTLYKRPEPNKWSVAEIVAHLAETELVLGWRYRSAVEKNGVTLQPFEQDDWAENSQYQKTDIREMLEMYSVIRNANLNFLTGLPKEKLEHYGMHQERGKETIKHLMNLEAGHDLNHLKQIKRILKK